MLIRFSTNRHYHPNRTTTVQDLKKPVYLTQRGDHCPMTTIQTTLRIRNHPMTMNPTGHL
tara:strand:- start:205 stop:384 length:180 start_codon:yes stop_codon:yes gene_type:complete